MTPRLIGVTGGIGSGKSVVCRICALRGIPVYDCDSRAKLLMTGDGRLRAFLCSEVGEEAFCSDGSLNRQRLSRHIFGCPEARHRVETEVHDAVRADIGRFVSATDAPVVLVESAILHTSHLDEIVSEIWLVDAPQALRMKRVAERSALPIDEIQRRMDAQQCEFDSLPPGKLKRILNDGKALVLPRVDALLKPYMN